MELLKDFYTVAELAELLDLMPPAIRQQIKKGKLTATKFNGAYLIAKEEAERLIKEKGGK